MPTALTAKIKRITLLLGVLLVRGRLNARGLLSISGMTRETEFTKNIRSRDLPWGYEVIF